MAELATLKPVVWIGSTRKDLRSFPEEVRDVVGYALYVAQQGSKHLNAKPLSGFSGAGVLEIISDYRGDTYRAVYTVRFGGRVYALHAFQKKARSGIKTPKAEMNWSVAVLRLRKSCTPNGPNIKRKTGFMSKKIDFEEGTGNVFEDIGLPHAQDRLAKADLAFRISETIRARRLTQTAAAKLLMLISPKSRAF